MGQNGDDRNRFTQTPNYSAGKQFFFPSKKLSNDFMNFQNKINFNFYLKQYIKINSTWTIDLKTNTETSRRKQEVSSLTLVLAIYIHIVFVSSAKTKKAKMNKGD